MYSQAIINRDIIVVGQQPWDVTLGSNCKNIALEFSRHNRVLYVNSPLDRISSIRQRHESGTIKRLNIIKGKEKGLIALQSNLWNLYPDCLVESINWINPKKVFDFFNRWNAKKFAASIHRALEQLGFNDYILFNDNEILKCFYLKELLLPATAVYYSRDYILATDYWKKHGVRLEPLVIAKSDVCVANSTYLADYCKRYNPRSFYVGQGCELEIFQRNKYITPAELQHTKHPIVGYVGALIANRLDIDVLLHIAQQRPHWSLVLVGPEDESFRKSALHNLENVHFTGSKPGVELPDYIQAFDVCLNPQALNELTIGNYPRKIDEYLAMGKPVVATKTKAMEVFEDYVYLAAGSEDYLRFITQALEEDNHSLGLTRKAFAATHTWENSVAAIYKAIAQ